MQICEQLKTVRLLKGWSQEQLAEKLNLSLNGYAKIERGETDVNLSKVQHIADELGIDPMQLLSLNHKNIFNISNDCRQVSNQGNIVLSETQCVHELEKMQLLLQARDQEIKYLHKEIKHLETMLTLSKKNSGV